MVESWLAKPEAVETAEKMFWGETMKKLIAILCSTSALAFALPAHAAPASAEPTSGTSAAESSDDAIIVTARRREENVQSIPVVVNAVTAEAIGKLNLRNFGEIQSLIPGLQLRVEPNGFGASAQIRGVAYNANASAQPSVEFYYNDAPITSAYVQQQMYDIGQIEVARGPQGTLRGRASPSGAISVSTRKPDLNQAGGYVASSASNLGTLNINGGVGLPIIPGVLAVRVAGLYTTDEVNRIHTVNPGLDGRGPHSDTRAGRASVLLQPSDWLRIEGVYQHLGSHSRSYDQYASFGLVNPAAPASPRSIKPADLLSIEETPRDVDQKLDMFNWRGEVRFAGQKLIYQGQYAKISTTSTTDTDAANYFVGRDTFQLTTGHSTTASHEVRLQNEERVLGMFDYVVGGFDWSQKSPTSLLVDTAVTLPAFLGGGIAAVAQTPITTTQILHERSFFGNLTAHIGDKFQISAGARHIHFTSPATTLSIAGNALPGSAQVNDNNWIYSASAQYFITPDVMVYASTGTSQRPGPTIVGNFSLVSSDRERSFQYMNPESSRSYEIGFKSAFFDKRVILNLTAFHQTFSNYTYKISQPIYYQNFTFINGAVVPVVGQSAQFASNVPLEVNGLEAEIGWKVTPHFNLNVVASYASSKIKNGTVPCDDLNGDGVPDTLTTAPTLAQIQAAYGANYIGACKVSQRGTDQSPFSATVQAEYTHPVSDKVEFFTRGLFAFQGNSLNDPNNAFDNVGGYGLLDLFAGVRGADGAWEVNFFAKNLFNTVKATTFGLPATTSYQELQPPTFQTTAGATAVSTYSIINTTRPRELGVSVRFAFGAR